MEYVEKPKKSHTFALADRRTGVITTVPMVLRYISPAYANDAHACDNRTGRSVEKPPATSDKSQEMSGNYSEIFGNDTKISGGMDDEGN